LMSISLSAPGDREVVVGATAKPYLGAAAEAVPA
jgi:hypothetical protein